MQAARKVRVEAGFGVYVPNTKEKQLIYRKLRRSLEAYADNIDELLPEGAYKAAALRALRTVSMAVNAELARPDPLADSVG